MPVRLVEGHKLDEGTHWPGRLLALRGPSFTASKRLTPVRALIWPISLFRVLAQFRAVRSHKIRSGSHHGARRRNLGETRVGWGPISIAKSALQAKTRGRAHGALFLLGQSRGVNEMSIWMPAADGAVSPSTSNPAVNINDLARYERRRIGASAGGNFPPLSLCASAGYLSGSLSMCSRGRAWEHFRFNRCRCGSR